MPGDRPLHLFHEDLLAARVDRDRVAAQQLDLPVGPVPGPVPGDGVADAVDHGEGARRLVRVAETELPEHILLALDPSSELVRQGFDDEPWCFGVAYGLGYRRDARGNKWDTDDG